MRIVLKQERNLYVLDEPFPEEPADNAPRAEKNAYEKHHNDSIDVACLMLATMSYELQKDLEIMEAYDMIFNLKEMFQQQARQERYETTKALHSCKMAEDASVSAHVLKMKGYIEHLDRLGFPLSQELETDLILNSLPDSYGQFVMNYNMNEMDKSISELHTMLKTAEKNIKSKPCHVLMVQNGKGFKKKGKGKLKAKGKSNAQPKPNPEPKAKAPKEGVCFFCNEPGHWKRNCKLYLEDLKKKKKTGETSSLGIYVIQINFSPSSSWVLDTECGSHICTNVQGLKRSNNITIKKFKSNDLNSTYLWHCRLGYINEKHISKLHQVGLLNSFDFESYDTCESCLLGKMTKDPFTGHSERANELLDLIHTDVCGPLSSDARGGYKYFITFTDDFDELKSHLFLVHFSVLFLVRIEYLIYRIMQKLTKLSLAGKEKGRRKMQQ